MNNNKQTQKESVYQTVVHILEQKGIKIEPGMVVDKYLSDSDKSTIREILFQGFKNGVIELEKEYDDSTLKKYVSGLVNNWLRKDTRLNGGSKYVPKNPGSRTGSTDPQIRAMKSLLSILTDPSERSEVESEIVKRLTEIQKSKNKVEVDVESLPEHLRKFIK